MKMIRRMSLAGGVLAACTAASFLFGQGVSENLPTVGVATRSDVSQRLRDIKPGPLVQLPNREIPNVVRFTPPGHGPKEGADSLTQFTSAATSPNALTPAPSLSFDGTSDDDNAAVAGGRVVPPDTNGDVGPNHYIQMNNLVFEIFNKSGVSVLGPLPSNVLWSGFGGICQTNNDGDPIVFHDQLADRWVFSQFAIGATGHQCFAVSTTPDPTGSFFRYDFEISPGQNGFNDYPKIGMWPDAYYLSANQFGGPSQSFQNPIAVAFDRVKMVAGDPTASFVKFNVTASGGQTFFSLQPSHWEGSTPPPSGAPNIYAMSYDVAAWGGTGSDGYQLWQFSVNFASPASSTFTYLGKLATTAFDANLCNFSACVPQPSPGEILDTLAHFTMYRLSYRNLAGTEVLVGTHSVDVATNLAGLRWFELRKSGGSWTLFQTGTYAPSDGLHRWMGSATMDGAGNIAIGYTASSTGQNPSIRYNTRTAADALGTLPGGEVVCVAGGGVQTSSFNRWGDYASISVDPTDDCTFWMTNEYYSTTGNFDFNTRVCAFKLSNCPGGGGCTPTENPETSCNDGIDNDCDGLIDAADPDCQGPTQTTVTFVSIGAEDGYVRESTETSGVGGSFSATLTSTSALRVGDDNQDRQYRSIVSFDTSSIPDGATILSATLSLTRGTLSGTNPFTTHGACLVDISNGGFGGNTALAAGDFQAAATASSVATLSAANANLQVSSGSLNATGLNAINKTGTTQFRIRFTLDDNDDRGNDFIGYYSGENSTASRRPALVVTYQ